MAQYEPCTDIKEFSERNVALLNEFMHRYALPQEYYGRLAIQYVRTATRYNSEPELRRYSFSTILWLRLRSELSHIMREQLRKPEVIPLEQCYKLPEHIDEYESLLLHSVEQKLTPRQKQVFRLRLSGKTNMEIAQDCGISRSAVEHLFSRIRRRIRDQL